MFLSNFFQTDNGFDVLKILAVKKKSEVQKTVKKVKIVPNPATLMEG